MTTSGRTTVAVIGLGRMGGAMADHIIDAGHNVAVFDISEAAMNPRIERGARRATSPADAANGADVITLVVFDDQQARETLMGPVGAIESITPGAVVCVHTTVSIDTMHQLDEYARARGVSILDAGVSGGEPGAAKGTLLTMVGGDASAVERARPVMDAFSNEVIHAGALGAGMALKLARNAAGYAMMAATHEAMKLAYHSGIDIKVLQHVIADTGVLEQAMAPFAFGDPVLYPDDGDSGMRTIMEHTNRLAAKDLDQALSLAQHCRIDTPVIDATRRSFHSVVRLAAN